MRKRIGPIILSMIILAGCDFKQAQLNNQNVNIETKPNVIVILPSNMPNQTTPKASTEKVVPTPVVTATRSATIPTILPTVTGTPLATSTPKPALVTISPVVTSTGSATIPAILPTVTEPPLATPTPKASVIPISIEMIQIPAGNFAMGADNNDTNADSDEKPQHTVYLDSYKISKYEITQGQYKIFMDATGQPAPTGDWDPVNKANYPVTYVSWNDAVKFCEWVGGRLPTEAEWEKAARGTDGRKYPWGNTSPTCTKANYCSCGKKTKPVGSATNGASPYGVMDMAGNVWEWCSDWYSNYYSISPVKNPQGADSGTGRVGRGGSWNYYDYGIRSSNRIYGNPSGRDYDLGFRIVMVD